jgi:hypothetical protein
MALHLYPVELDQFNGSFELLKSGKLKVLCGSWLHVKVDPCQRSLVMYISLVMMLKLMQLLVAMPHRRFEIERSFAKLKLEPKWFFPEFLEFQL